MPLKVTQEPSSLRSMMASIKKLQRDLTEFRAQKTLERSSIGAGGMSIYGGLLSAVDPGGTQVFGVGLVPDGNWATRVGRVDGTTALTVGDQAVGMGSGQMVRTWSRSGDIIACDDPYADNFLGRPWMPLAFFPTAAVQTTSTTLQTAWTGGNIAQNPVAELAVQNFVPTGTSASFTCLYYNPDGSTDVWDTWTITGASTYSNHQITHPLDGAEWGSYVAWDIRHQVTSGTGTISTQMLHAYTRNTASVAEVPAPPT